MQIVQQRLLVGSIKFFMHVDEVLILMCQHVSDAFASLKVDVAASGGLFISYFIRTGDKTMSSQRSVNHLWSRIKHNHKYVYDPNSM